MTTNPSPTPLRPAAQWHRYGGSWQRQWSGGSVIVSSDGGWSIFALNDEEIATDTADGPVSAMEAADLALAKLEERR
jgi:hypothetical protein